MSIRKKCPCDMDGICPYEDMHSGYMNGCEYWCGAEEPQDDPGTWEDETDQLEDAKRVLRVLRSAQNNLLSVMFDVDDNRNLERALTLIGDKMDDISNYYGLPIASEQ